MTSARGRPRGWTAGLGARVVPVRRPNAVVGLFAGAVGVALATLAISALKHAAPVVSLSVVYLPAVLLVSTYWGLALGLCTSLLSAAAFNWFHLPPSGRFTIADNRNWVALIAFVVVAVLASAVAELARTRALEAERRRGEADLAAALAQELLLGEDTDRALGSAARRVSEALGLNAASIVAGPHPPAPSGAGKTVALALNAADGTRIGTLTVPAGLDPETDRRLRAQVVPTLAALVAIAQRRDALQAERVQTEALRRSDDIKTALLRAVSHDLRTPLTSIVASGHALGASSLDDTERDELSDVVVSQATRLAGLVDKLLDLSRLQAGTARPRADWISVDDLLAAAVEGLPGEGADVQWSVAGDVPLLRADAAQLERALANLLENARRYGGATAVHVDVRATAERVIISVVDQGQGIEPADIGRIFEPFYRGPPARPPAHPPARSSERPDTTGSGLGLAIAKGFIEANGGTIAVRSLPGQGTRFTIVLPVAAEAAAEVPEASDLVALHRRADGSDGS